MLLHHPDTAPGSRLYAGRVSLCAPCRLGVLLLLQCRLLHHTQTPRHHPATREKGDNSLEFSSLLGLTAIPIPILSSILGTLHNLQLFMGLVLFMTWILFIKSLKECFPRIYLFLSSPNNKIRFICFPVKRKYCICFLQKNGTEKLFLRLAKILEKRK